jgi:group I intron endonuclease
MSAKKVSGIYKITNPIGQLYVGRSKDIKRRWREHRNSKSSVNTKLAISFIKYGTCNHTFEILELCDAHDALQREMFWKMELNTVSSGLNYFYSEEKPMTWTTELKDKVSKTRTGMKKTSDWKDKIRQSLMGHYGSFNGRTHTPEVRKVLSEKGKGIKCLNNGIKNIKVRPHEIQHYLNDGWVLGMLKNYSK